MQKTLKTGTRQKVVVTLVASQAKIRALEQVFTVSERALKTAFGTKAVKKTAEEFKRAQLQRFLAEALDENLNRSAGREEPRYASTNFAVSGRTTLKSLFPSLNPAEIRDVKAALDNIGLKLRGSRVIVRERPAPVPARPARR